MVNLYELYEQVQSAIQGILNLGQSNPDGPVGIHYWDLPLTGTEKFSHVAVQPGNFMDYSTNPPLPAGPPSPNSLAYITLATTEAGNAAYDRMHARIAAAGGFTDIPYPWDVTSGYLIDYTNPESRAAVMEYVDSLLDAGYSGIFIDDHDMMAYAAAYGYDLEITRPNLRERPFKLGEIEATGNGFDLGPRAEETVTEFFQLTTEHAQAEQDFVRELILHIQERDAALVFNGIWDIDMMRFLGEHNVEVMSESFLGELGELRQGLDLNDPGSLNGQAFDQWGIQRLEAYAEGRAAAIASGDPDQGGGRIHFVEGLPLEGMSIFETRDALEPFVEQIKNGLGLENASLYVSHHEHYSSLTPQQEPPVVAPPQPQRGVGGRE